MRQPPAQDILRVTDLRLQFKQYRGPGQGCGKVLSYPQAYSRSVTCISSGRRIRAEGPCGLSGDFAIALYFDYIRRS
jgi:hypothetical protein